MRIRSLLLATAAFAVPFGLATAALAASAGRAAGGAGGAHGAPGSLGGRLKVPGATSPTFAGYSIQGGGEGSWVVTTHIVVPKLRCTSGPERAIAASVGVYNSSNQFSAASVFVGCYGGKAHYFLSLVLNGGNHNYTSLKARPGDKVALHVSQGSKGTTVSVVDKSRLGIKKTLKGAGSIAGSAPWVGDSGWDNPGLLGVPNFGTMHFSGSTLNGKAFGSSGALARSNRVNGTTIQITTSAFASNHESFSTVFKHS